MRQFLNEKLVESLRLVLPMLLLIYSAFILLIVVFKKTLIGGLMLNTTLGIMIVIVLIMVGIKRYGLPSQFAHPIGMIIVILITVNSALNIFFTASPYYIVHFVLIMIGLSSFMLRTVWAISGIVFVNIVWVIVYYALAAKEATWLESSFTIGAATLLSLLFHSTRKQTLVKLEQTRVNETYNRLTMTKALDALRVSEENYRTLTENSIDIIWAYDPVEDCFKFVSGAAEHILGYSHEEALNLSLEELFSPATQQTVVSAFRQLSESKSPEKSIVLEAEHIKKDKTTIWLEIHGGLVYDQASQTKLIHGVSRDITLRKQTEEANRRVQIAETAKNILETQMLERKKVEAKLLENQRVLATLLSNLPGMAYQGLADERRTMTFVSEGCFALTGFTTQDFMQESEQKVYFGQLIDENERASVQKEIEFAITRKEPFRIIYRITTADGRQKWVWERSQVVVTDNNPTPTLEGFISDITERFEAEIALQESEERLRLALEATEMGIWDFDIITNRVFWSEEVELLFDLIPGTLEPNFNAIFDYVHPDDLPKLQTTIANIGKLENHFHVEFRTKSNDESPPRWLASKGTIFHGIDSRPIRVMGNIYDITTHKNAEAALLEGKIRAEEANRLKDSILANMSHEIRTPMTAILGFAELLLRRLAGSDLEKHAKMIYQGGNRLLLLLNNIIDLARLEAGKVEFRKQPHPLHQSLARVVDMFSVLAQKKNIDLQLDIDSDLQVNTDAQREEQILNNIVGNAIRFTQKGGVTIRAHADKLFPEGIAVAKVEIIDTGIGISEKFLPHAFDEFRQESQGLSRTHEGSGLGLAIAKKLIENMGGQIYLDSKKNVGTTVTLYLPLAQAGTTSAAEAETNNPLLAVNFAQLTPALRILVVEDDFACTELLQEFLSPYHTIVALQDIKQALLSLKNNRYDLIFLDIHFRGKNIDGIQILEQINNLPNQQSIPIVALTAFAMKGDRERFLQNGFDEYIEKPFSPQSLYNVLAKLKAAGKIH